MDSSRLCGCSLVMEPTCTSGTNTVLLHSISLLTIDISKLHSCCWSTVQKKSRSGSITESTILFYAPSKMSHFILYGFGLFKCSFGHIVLSIHIMYTLLSIY